MSFPSGHRARVFPVSAVWVLVVCLLTGCVGPGPPPGSAQAQADAQTRAACRQRADEEYNIRHRDTIYAPPSNVNTPYSANYAPGDEDRSLSQLFERDNILSDCVRNTGAEGDRTPEQAVSPAPPAVRP